MIEPVSSGAALSAEIRDTKVDDGTVAVWRLGQAGVVVKFPSTVVLVDAYLSNHCEAVLPEPFDHRRLTRSPLDPTDLALVDIIIVTHDHLDHLDVPTLRTLARYPSSTVIAPAAAAPTLRDLGWGEERIIATAAGGTVTVHGLTVDAFAVPHDEFDHSEQHGAPYQGFVVSDGSFSFAHVGDARDHVTVREVLRSARPDVLFLPINGRNEHRAALGFAGNMTAEEAVDLSAEVGPASVVPVHYDMFAQNIDQNALQHFVTAAHTRNVPHAVLDVGERVIFTTEGADRGTDQLDQQF